MTSHPLKPFLAAEIRAEEKNAKWIPSCTDARMLFSPFVIEATGAIPPQSATLIMEAAGRAQEQWHHQVRDLYNEFTQRIVRAVWLGNADLVATALWQTASANFSQATLRAREAKRLDWSIENLEIEDAIRVGNTTYGYLSIITDYAEIAESAKENGIVQSFEEVEEEKHEEGRDSEGAEEKS